MKTFVCGEVRREHVEWVYTQSVLTASKIKVLDVLTVNALCSQSQTTKRTNVLVHTRIHSCTHAQARAHTDTHAQFHAKKENLIHIASAPWSRKVDTKHVIMLGQGMRKECEWVREL